MKKLTVYLRTGQRPHPVYHELLENPPTGIKYIGAEKKHYSSNLPITHKIKVDLFDICQKIFLPIIPFTSSADIIHSTNNILLLTNNKWVIDCESASGFFGFKDYKINSKIYRKIVKTILMQKNCTAILPWSEAAKNTIYHLLDDKELMKKVHVIYPAKKIESYKKKNKHHLIFVGRRFFEKGGIYALETMKAINEKYQIKSTVISNPPQEIIEKYSKYGIEFKQPNLKKEEMTKEYDKSTIMLFPTFIDTFGYTTLEAMSHGIPTITTKVFAMTEMVENEKNGITINAPITPYTKENIFDSKKFKSWNNFVKIVTKSPINDEFLNKFIKNTSKLIESKKFYLKLSKNCIKEIKKGKFSIKYRNKKLKKLYENTIA